MTVEPQSDAITTLTSDERMYRRDELLIRLEARRLRRQRPLPRQHDARRDPVVDVRRPTEPEAS